MFGEGVYTLAEVTRYTGVPASTLRSWFMPRSDGKGHGPIFHSEWETVEDDFAVSFLNLIEAHVASFFRDKGCKPSHIRKVHQILKDGWKIAHPFASMDLRTDQRKIILNRVKDAALIDIEKNQLVLETARPFLLKIDYDTTSRLAVQWNIAEGVVINPKIGFGKPVIAKTGVSTSIIANQYLANQRDVALVARMFDIPRDGVVKAFEFERKFGRVAA